MSDERDKEFWTHHDSKYDRRKQQERIQRDLDRLKTSATGLGERERALRYQQITLQAVQAFPVHTDWHMDLSLISPDDWEAEEELTNLLEKVERFKCNASQADRESWESEIDTIICGLRSIISLDYFM